MAKAFLLTALFVKQVREPGVYRDGQGLVLRVFESGAKRWVLRVTARGRRRDVGLGSASEVSLAEARERAAERRKDVREGRDPVAAQRAARTSIPTFRDAAEQEHQRRCKGWRDGKHRDQWINTLRQHAFRKIGDRLVSDVTMADVLDVLTPIWLAKAETARRVRQRLRVVLERARVAGHRDGINPVDAIGAALQKQPRRSRHHAAVPYADMPALMRRLHASNGDGLVRLALEFTILTAMRTGEVLGARWEEIDLPTATWTIPAERMKVEVEHRVPLSDRCVEMLRLARALAPKSELVFPSRKRRGEPLSDMAMLMHLRRLGRSETVHGFRSSFRDWAAEETNFQPQVCEAALAHQVENRVEGAYRRGDLFAKRRELMKAWERFITGGPNRLDQRRTSQITGLHGAPA
ncbi:tyrosine-type recombinase/integrase [Hyphomicrobium album]|uniref:tyrosine-type recombinase/integrase n=1 Tax=Hyphomicrobium album TaxID=2665159 RepID=UPI002D21B5BD|nr:integrase arm-type DNA-binding domain-containing protein [Hyphomicrobium album]